MFYRVRFGLTNWRDVYMNIGRTECDGPFSWRNQRSDMEQFETQLLHFWIFPISFQVGAVLWQEENENQMQNAFRN